MRMRAIRWAALLSLAPLVGAAVPQPSDWVPARWPWSDAKSLELLADSTINCLLLKTYSADFVTAAASRGLVLLAVIPGTGDAVAAAHTALSAGVTGVVLEGSFPDDTVAAVGRAAGNAPVIQLTARNHLPLGSKAPIIGTYQGVWPGIEIEANGAAKAGPTGSVWIDTNSGFLRAVRVLEDASLWMANEPPQKTIVTGTRYLQVIADAAMAGARWVLALDDDFASRLNNRQAAALHDWGRMMGLMRYFEAHPEWRRMREYGRVAVVQDPAEGGLFSGGVLDMLAVKHLPARSVPPQLLTAEAIHGAKVTLNLDAGDLSANQQKVLRDFPKGGGMLLNMPPIWKDAGPMGERFTPTKAESDALDSLWHELNSALQRRDYGVSLFNVSSMISNVLVSEDGKTIVVHLVNYSDYPVEDVSAVIPDDYKKATLITPDGADKTLEIAPSIDGPGVTIAKMSVCATIKIEQ